MVNLSEGFSRHKKSTYTVENAVFYMDECSQRVHSWLILPCQTEAFLLLEVYLLKDLFVRITDRNNQLDY